MATRSSDRTTPPTTTPVLCYFFLSLWLSRKMCNKQWTITSEHLKKIYRAHRTTERFNNLRKIINKTNKQFKFIQQQNNLRLGNVSRWPHLQPHYPASEPFGHAIIQSTCLNNFPSFIFRFQLFNFPFIYSVNTLFLTLIATCSNCCKKTMFT